MTPDRAPPPAPEEVERIAAALVEGLSRHRKGYTMTRDTMLLAEASVALRALAAHARTVRAEALREALAVVEAEQARERALSLTGDDCRAETLLEVIVDALRALACEHPTRRFNGGSPICADCGARVGEGRLVLPVDLADAPDAPAVATSKPTLDAIQQQLAEAGRVGWQITGVRLGWDAYNRLKDEVPFSMRTEPPYVWGPDGPVPFAYDDCLGVDEWRLDRRGDRP